MIVTLAIVVFCASIAAFFAQEFGSMFKRFFAIPGMKLLFPLVVASWFIEIYEEWGLWLLLRIQAWLHQFVHKLHVLIPFEQGSLHFTKIVYLFFVACLPLLISQLASIKKWRRNRVPHTYWLGLVLWVIAAILLTLSSVPT